MTQELDDIVKKKRREIHEEYLKAIKVIQVDCMYIVELCHKVVDAILQIFEFNFSEKHLAEVV